MNLLPRVFLVNRTMLCVVLRHYAGNPFFILSSFWTSRGHRCRPLFPPGSCFQFLSRIGFSNPTARRFFTRVLLPHALALSASQLVYKRNSLRIYTSMHSGGLELTKLTYARLDDSLIRYATGATGLTRPTTKM